jgi:hypothetical protein
MNRVSYFEFSALDMNRAKAFWEKTFGWEFQKYEGMDYYAVKTGKAGDGIDGGLSPREKDNQVVNNIDVANIDQTVKDIVRNGGTILVPKTEIPGMGHYAIFTDSEDNTFSIMQST